VRALVLGGGGIAGIAWETGILHGLGEAALDVDMIIGTSAGSAVAAAVSSDVPLAELYERQTTPPPADSGRSSPPMSQLVEVFTLFASMPEMEPAEARRKVSELALTAETMPEEQWKKVIGAGLPSHEWPSRKIGTVAVDALTGETRIFDKESGADLVSAVAASCAVPGVYPPVTIDGRKYIDGGVRTTTNADLVAEYDEILVIAPIPDAMSLPNAVLITPDEESLTAMTANVLDPATRVPSAKAGYEQALKQQVRIWHR
jgi:NTE family protein